VIFPILLVVSLRVAGKVARSVPMSHSNINAGDVPDKFLWFSRHSIKN
jgi:hypothetical protein